uniref:Uncharacterized protein n=1 Tax=Tetranychus urticae TaxID=32264 RepID=T1KJX3_TETUR
MFTVQEVEIIEADDAKIWNQMDANNINMKHCDIIFGLRLFNLIDVL